MSKSNSYNPLVSIITLCYNQENYIYKCLDSVINQTYQNWEMVIVDDFSTDGTIKVINLFKDSRIKLLLNEKNNGPEGLGNSYNKALQNCNGELIAILEGDDYWPLEKLEKQIKFHDNNDIVLSWGQMQKVGINKPKQRKYNDRKLSFKPLLSDLLVANMIPAVTVMIKKINLENVGGFWQPEGAVLVDHPTWIKLSLEGKFLYIPELLGIYRIHEKQISMNYAEKMLISSVNYVNYFLSEVSEEISAKLDLKKIKASQKLKIANLNYITNNRMKAIEDYINVIYSGRLSQKIDAIRALFRI